MAARLPAKLNGHDPRACHKDLFERLPTQKSRDLVQFLSHAWQPGTRTVEPEAAAATSA